LGGSFSPGSPFLSSGVATTVFTASGGATPTPPPRRRRGSQSDHRVVQRGVCLHEHLCF
jgi:hypothetical protein